MKAIELFKAGYTDLVSVIPVGASLSPNSKVKPDSIGKAPGKKTSDGTWAGYPWYSTPCAEHNARNMDIQGANIGLSAARFPALDIDCTDAGLSRIIEELAITHLGSAPKRVGRAPKALLMYRASEPFGRMRLQMNYKGERHLLEFLGAGQQYVVAGIHPKTNKPYEWDCELPAPHELVEVTHEMVNRFLDIVQEEIEFLGVECKREGVGAVPGQGAPVDQESLKAPSMEALREAVELVPNDAVTYEEYVQFGIAVKAAGQDDPMDAFEIFLDWAERWEAGFNDPDNVTRDWDKMRSPYRIGWDYIAQKARENGYNDAAHEFEAVAPADTQEVIEAPVGGPAEYSDRAMSNRFAAKYVNDLKYCAALGGWILWDGTVWAKDDQLKAENLAGKVLVDGTMEVLNRMDFKAEKCERIASYLSSAKATGALLSVARSDRRMAVAAEKFDADPWLLNTPGGVVDLRTGELRARADKELFSKCAGTTPDFKRKPARWLAFLKDVTAGNQELIDYLQRECGYWLTGVTTEQHLSFLHGSGGNGKSLFVNTMASIMGDYAGKAQMETFTAGKNDRHPTELASLRGLRMVYASETGGNGRWNEARIKELTGGEPITARYIGKDPFSFIPQFKLIFLGNHKPELSAVDNGLKRRFNLLPFTVTPARPDPLLFDKLREEWASILGWAVQGCLLWQEQGLNPPKVIRAATEEYFADEDSLGRWLNERTFTDKESRVYISSVFEDWRDWCGENAEYAGSLKRFSQALKARGFEKVLCPMSRRAMASGLGLIKDPDFPVEVVAKQEARA